MLQVEQTAFETALAAFRDNSAFERASAQIARSRRRFVIGRGSSQSHALTFAAELKASLSQVHPIIAPATDHLDLLADVRPTDVLIAFCLSPYRRDTVEISKLYVASGGTLLLITDSADSPLSAFASEQIIVPSAAREPAASSLAVFLAIQILAQLASASSKGALRRTQERERISELLELHTPDMRWIGRGSEPPSGNGFGFE
ncbi:MurR/RpiR family transcriptional regulator [Leucobacter coleopterorum]|uniref:MurR/RpiR family transcriptional regulator n=1 Tax=Leucobacter coleopterorum TaxID=2714933 RepID=A0ABX6JXK4_9MICO|nr:SIS domain-containing protein [Leucobacter coleopterorum]QIM19031.1 MurR/RpiR family transcriptional regulator [Leucobacter coleopterorum]